MVERSANPRMTQYRVGGLGNQLRDAAQSLLLEEKERVAIAVEGYADAFHHAAAALDRNRQFGAAYYAELAAARIERIAVGVRNRPFTDMAAYTETFARRRPTLFVTGAIAVGFVLGRLLIRTPRRDGSRALGTAKERL